MNSRSFGLEELDWADRRIGGSAEYRQESRGKRE
jgi:hypothetical protein